MKKVSLDLTKDALKKVAEMKFSSKNEKGWSFDSKLTAAKYAGASAVGIAVGIGISYVW